MKVLVTGGAGFIGSHLVDRLLADGKEVIVLDDLSTGKLENLPLKHPNLHIVEISIVDDIGYYFKGVKTVFHLAALTRPQKSILEPHPTNLVNITGTLNVLLACRDNNVNRLVFASSSSLYGEQPTYPSSESARPLPMSPYALQKLVGEQYCELFQRIYGLESNCLRFFNVYGLRQDPNGYYACVIPKFIQIMKAGGVPEIYGDGRQARDFTHINDVVEAIVLASESEVTGEVFNVGLGHNCSINDLFSKLAKKLDYHQQPIYGPAMVEPTQTLAENSKALKLLGWKPKIELDEGLEELI